MNELPLPPDRGYDQLPDEIDIQTAANVLNVSKPYVEKLIDEGELHARESGAGRTHKIMLRRDQALALRIKLFHESLAANRRAAQLMQTRCASPSNGPAPSP